ncbi:hypothetical protein Tco_0040895 [Tanacetum coccineum]
MTRDCRLLICVLDEEDSVESCILRELFQSSKAHSNRHLTQGKVSKISIGSSINFEGFLSSILLSMVIIVTVVIVVVILIVVVDDVSLILKLSFAIIVEEEDGEWIRFLGSNSSLGIKKYRGLNNNDGGNTGDGVKIAGGVIGLGDEIGFSEELKELLPNETGKQSDETEV